jgi:hypothetical protein
MYIPGWVEDPAAVDEQVDKWESYGMPRTFSQAAPDRMIDSADDAPVFFWKAEEKVLGHLLATWGQLRVGSCVGFGSTRTAQDLMLWEIASGEPEMFPGELCPEVTYGGSRVEVGGGRIRGDGSVGAWAAEFLRRWGIVVRGVYGALDLTKYTETQCRDLGRNGLPTDLENVAKVHPVRSVAPVVSAEEGWAAMGAGKPVFVCSNVGYDSPRDKAGYCVANGRWDHCMGTRGRFVQPDRGRSVVIGNSWLDYLGSANNVIQYVDVDGSIKQIELPAGHFATTYANYDRMVRQKDSFALAGLTGWAKTVVDYTP